MERVRTVAAALLIPPLLHLMALDRLVRWLAPVRLPAKTRNDPPDEVIADWVTATLQVLPGPWRNTCLRRSVVLLHLLRRAGRPVLLCIGVRRSPSGEFTAHAWLLKDGQPYLEPQPSVPADYTLIARFPETTTTAPAPDAGRPAA